MKTKNKIRSRKNLSVDGLFQIIRVASEKINDHRSQKVGIELSDAIMSAFAMFSLKEPSLLAFEEKRNDQNMKNVYKIRNVPSDTHMRTLLDEIDPAKIYPIYKKVFAEVQREKGLEDMVFYEGHYLLSNDGTGYFSSDKIHCKSCMEKVNSKTGNVKYYHQFLGSCLVHPDVKEVIPLGPEPIKKSDGSTKNDCEQNASKRFLKRFRREHPHLKIIMIEDALASKAPHIRDLEAHDIRYILGAKAGDHKFLFDYVDSDKYQTIEHKQMDENGVVHKFRFANKVPLNAGNQDLLVNFIEYWETKPNGKKLHFSWVTDLDVTKENVFLFMRGGRARWKIENETFNTLKNQGYQFEHNFGHGKKNLSTVFALIMMLAFFVDQVQQKLCPLFRGAWEECKTKRSLWEKMRAYFTTLIFSSMKEILEAILYGINKPKAQDLILYDTS